MSMRPWVRNRIARPAARPVRTPPRRVRPALEALEDRTVLSTFTVLNTLDDGGTGSLRWAIGQANSRGGADTIAFDGGVFSTPKTITLDGGPLRQLRLSDTTGATTIAGPAAGVTVASGSVTGDIGIRMFQVDANVTTSISNLTLNGTGMANAGTATLSNCTLTGNFYRNELGGLTFDGPGGGLYNTGTVNLSACTISRNATRGLGGGLYNAGTANLTGCTIAENITLSSGGGLYNAPGATISLSGCNISTNLAEAGGGGLYNAGTATLSGGYVTFNVTTAGGGGIHNVGTATLSDRCVIASNEATGGGGGGLFNAGTATASLTSCVMVGNKGQQGGGVYNNGTATLSRSLITGNVGTIDTGSRSGLQGGGGVYNNGTVTLTDSTLHANSAPSALTNNGFNAGGGLANNGTATLINCTVTGNNAAWGGGVSTGGTVLRPVNASDLFMVNCTINGNSAGDGGGMAIFAGRAFLTNCTVSNNSAYTGGGLLLSFGSTSLVNTIVAGNTNVGGSRSSDIDYGLNGPKTPFGSNNLIGTGGSAGLVNGINGNIVLTSLTNLGLAPLGDYGGPTQTMALLSGSEAIGKGIAVSGVTTDQRYVARHSTPSIGAYESQVASNLVVGTTSDEVDNTDGLISLREAIAYANGHTGADTITFDPTVFGTTPRTITLTGGELGITDDLTVQGPGADRLTVSGNNASRVFRVAAAGTHDFAFSGLTIAGGNADFGGGMLLLGSSGTLTIRGLDFSGNNASASGGGLYVQGNGAAATAVNISDTTFAGNHAAQIGAAGFVNAAATLSNCTISGNIASQGVGGLVALASGAGQTAAATLTNCTVADTSGPGAFGLMAFTQGGAAAATVRYANTIFARNASGNVLANGQGAVVTSLGHNLSDDGTGNLIGPGDRPNTDPRLAPLGDYGGPTRTMALLPGSPAINAGNKANAPATDQRGLPRFGNTDAGAFEYQFKVTSTAVAASAAPSTYGEAVTFTVTVTGTFTPTGGVTFVIDSGVPVAGLAGTTTGTTATWTFTTSTLAAGTHTVQAYYVGSGDFNDSSGTLSGGQVVNKADATVAVSGYAGDPYDGSAHTQTVTVTGVPHDGTLYSTSLTGTNAGSYSQPWSYRNANYNDVGATLAFSIAKAATGLGANAGGTYNGSPIPAQVYALGVGGTSLVPGGLAVTYYVGIGLSGTALGATAPTNAGAYTLLAVFTSSDPNYADAAGAGPFSIDKANVTVTVSGYAGGAYDGIAHTQTVTVTGVPHDGTLYSTSLTGTNAGSYSQPWSYRNANYNDVGATLAFSIDKAATGLGANAGGTYNGSPIPAQVFALGVDGSSLVPGSFAVTYYVGASLSGTSLGATAPTNAGTYTLLAVFTSSDPNYADAAGAGTFSIARANATVAVSGYAGGPYDGAAHTQTVTVTGVPHDGTLYSTSLTGTNAGSYSKPWSYSNANYNDVGATLGFTIDKAATTLRASTGGTYNGSPIPAKAFSLGLDGTTAVPGGFTYTYYVGASLSGTSLGATAPTNAGTYSVVIRFASSDPNYADAAGLATLTIAKANATVAVTPYTVTYDGSAHTATHTITGVNGEAGAAVGVVTLSTTHTGAGTYADSWSFAGAANYNDIAATPITDVINKAALTITANDDIKVYGTLKTFGGTAFTQTGLVAGDAITGVTETSAGAGAEAAVGTYPIVPGAATGSGLGNYAITYVSGTLTVFPPLTVPSGVQTAYEDADKAIGGISIDSRLGGSLTLTLGVGHGRLTLGTTGGLTVAGNGTGAVALTGTAANLNAALATLVYRGNLNFSGADTLSLTLGNGSFSSNTSVAITVASTAQQAAQLEVYVSGLVASGRLTSGQGETLNLNLRDNKGDAGKVQAFLNQVAAFLQGGILTQAEADSLLKSGNILLLGVTRR